jgi:hypothetical protein
VSGHKSLSGLSHYKRIENREKITMSQTLSSHLRQLSSKTSNPPRSEENCSTYRQVILPSEVNNSTYLQATSSSITSSQQDLPHQQIEHVEEVNLMIMDEPLVSSVSLPSTSVMQPTIMDLDDFGNIDIDQLLVQECEKFEKPLQLQNFFNNCTFNGNVSINFGSK